jgi:acyl-CoA thioester hydrolase
MKHRVRYHQTDMQGIVFNSRYLEIIDDAMTEYMRDRGFDPSAMAEVPFDPVLAHVDLTFVTPAVLDDELVIHAHCTRVGNTSFDISYRIEREADELIVRAVITYVNVDLTTRKAAPIPSNIREVLT